MKLTFAEKYFLYKIIIMILAGQVQERVKFGSKKCSFLMDILDDINTNGFINCIDVSKFLHQTGIVSKELINHFKSRVTDEIPVNKITHRILYEVNNKLWLANVDHQDNSSGLRYISDCIVCEKPADINKIVISYMDTNLSKVAAIKANGGCFKDEITGQWYQTLS